MRKNCFEYIIDSYQNKSSSSLCPILYIVKIRKNILQASICDVKLETDEDKAIRLCAQAIKRCAEKSREDGL